MKDKIKCHFRNVMKNKLKSLDEEIEPQVIPKPKREVSPKPREDDPFNVPAPYPKHYPQPKPKA